jgi:PelA/Pel-15E family pectate lyase
MKVSRFLPISILINVIQAIGGPSVEAAEPANILLIISEDTGLHFEPYQEIPITTPGINRLAAEGMVFTNAYATQASCSPSRSSIFTGLYPHQNGHLGLANRGFTTYKNVPNVVESLRQKGYYCVNYGKLHVHPESQFPFHVNTRGNWDNVEWLAEQARQVLRRARERPFFLTVSIPDAHRPFSNQRHGLPRTPLEADEADPLAFFGGVETPTVRGEVAGYYNGLARVDTGVDLLLDVLDKSGVADNTIVFYISDHGPAFSRGKVTTYDAGVNIPWVVRWPGKIPEGVVSPKLISTTDLMPTFLELIGDDIPEHLPGRSHLPLFENPEVEWRSHVFAEFNSHQPYYWPQRMVRDDRYKLIHNVKHDGPKPGLGIDGCRVRPAVLAGHYPEEAAGAYKIFTEDQPEYELYDLHSDPNELNNLAEDPAFAGVRASLTQELQAWQEKTDDPVRRPEGFKIFDEYYAEHGNTYEAFVLDGSKEKIDWNPFRALSWPVSIHDLRSAFNPQETGVYKYPENMEAVQADASVHRGNPTEDCNDRFVSNVRQAMKRAARFFRSEISSEGGYLWKYKSDMTIQEGEFPASRSTVWVQPPGTPTVGKAFLKAYHATRDRFYLDAALDAGKALLRGQLASGGWEYRIHFDEEAREEIHYRFDVLDGDTKTGDRRNRTNLDDNNTQSALSFLMDLDRATEFENNAIHDAIEYGLEAIMRHQYPNGAWPQRFSGENDTSDYPVVQARYPEEWSRDWPAGNYHKYYTLNDSAMLDTLGLMFKAHEVYGDQRYFDSARKGGEFLILAQMPEPQSAWAQQYNRAMEPVWARKFEPPAISGRESFDAMKGLLEVFLRTGEEHFLAPIAPALEWAERSRLPDGRLARFYELKTNRPLYFTKDYELTYDDSDLPTHYAFKISGKRIADMEQSYNRVRDLGRKAFLAERQRSEAIDRGRVKYLMETLDDEGRWVEKGRMHRPEKVRTYFDTELISTKTFANNLTEMALFLMRNQ